MSNPLDLVINGLYIGGQSGACNLQVLKQHRITHIVNTAAASCTCTFPQDFVYKALSLVDTPSQNMMQHFNETSSFIHEARLRGGNVLVHCIEGKSRSATCVIAYLMDYEGMSLAEAYAVVRRGRPIANPNEGFQIQLQHHENLKRGGGRGVNTQQALTQGMVGPSMGTAPSPTPLLNNTIQIPQQSLPSGRAAVHLPFMDSVQPIGSAPPPAVRPQQTLPPHVHAHVHAHPPAHHMQQQPPRMQPPPFLQPQQPSAPSTHHQPPPPPQHQMMVQSRRHEDFGPPLPKLVQELSVGSRVGHPIELAQRPQTPFSNPQLNPMMDARDHISMSGPVQPQPFGSQQYAKLQQPTHLQGTLSLQGGGSEQHPNPGQGTRAGERTPQSDHISHHQRARGISPVPMVMSHLSRPELDAGRGPLPPADLLPLPLAQWGSPHLGDPPRSASVQVAKNSPSNYAYAQQLHQNPGYHQQQGLASPPGRAPARPEQQHQQEHQQDWHGHSYNGLHEESLGGDAQSGLHSASRGASWPDPKRHVSRGGSPPVLDPKRHLSRSRGGSRGAVSPSSFSSWNAGWQQQQPSPRPLAPGSLERIVYAGSGGSPERGGQAERSAVDSQGRRHGEWRTMGGGDGGSFVQEGYHSGSGGGGSMIRGAKGWKAPPSPPSRSPMVHGIDRRSDASYTGAGSRLVNQGLKNPGNERGWPRIGASPAQQAFGSSSAQSWIGSSSDAPRGTGVANAVALSLHGADIEGVGIGWPPGLGMDASFGDSDDGIFHEVGHVERSEVVGMPGVMATELTC